LSSELSLPDRLLIAVTAPMINEKKINKARLPNTKVKNRYYFDTFIILYNTIHHHDGSRGNSGRWEESWLILLVKMLWNITAWVVGRGRYP
jgi:hypothetical protein